MLIDLFPYITLLLITLFLPKLFNNNRYVYILFVLYILFVCCRYGVGWDFFNYSNTIIDGGWRLERFEFLIYHIGLYCHKVQNPQLFISITGFLTVSLFMYTIWKHSNNVYISIIVYLCFPLFFLASLTTIRFSLSLAIIFYAYKYIDKSKISYYALIFTAFCIHNSAILALLTVPFLTGTIKINKAINILLFVTSFLLCTFLETGNFIKVIFEMIPDNIALLDSFMESSESYIYNSHTGGLSKSPYLYSTINVINFINYNKLCNDNNEKNKIMITMYNIGCCLMFIFSFDQTIASRICQLFMVYIILLTPWYNNIIRYKYLIYFILIFSFIFQITIPGNHPDFINRVNCFLPYSFFWKV